MKNKLYRFIKLTLLGILTLGLFVAIPKVEAAEKVKIGVVGEMAEVWRDVSDRLKNQDIDLELVEFSDFNTPNKALAEGDLDVASYQTLRSLEMFNEETGNDLKDIAYTVLVPMGIYSDKHKSIDDLPDGALVAIPNDNSSYSRALSLLETAGLIKLDPEAKYPQEDDIVENPKDIKIEALDSSQTASSLPDVDIALVNGGMAVDAGLDPTNDSIYLEPVDESSKEYFNVVTVRAEDVDKDVFKKIIAEYETEETAKKLAEIYGGGAIAVFKEFKN